MTTDFEIDADRRQPMQPPRRYSDLSGPDRILFDAQLAAYEAARALAQRSGSIAKAQQIAAAGGESTGAPTSEAHNIGGAERHWEEMRGRYQAARRIYRRGRTW